MIDEEEIKDVKKRVSTGDFIQTNENYNDNIRHRKAIPITIPVPPQPPLKKESE